jgi:hypothetical protein
MRQRTLGIGLAFGCLWLASGLLLGSVIGIVDPHSIDPGDLKGLVLIFGSMGLLSGVLFAVLTALAERGTPPAGLSLGRTAVWGVLATAIVQVLYLGHGDAGLAANIQMALVLSAFGGVMAGTWLLITRRWAHARPLYLKSVELSFGLIAIDSNRRSCSSVSPWNVVRAWGRSNRPTGA